MQSVKAVTKLAEEMEPPPHVGEIRLTVDGLRRKIFNGRSWRLLCNGDPTCPVQSNFYCRFHIHLGYNQQQSVSDDQTTPMETSLNESLSEEVELPEEEIKQLSEPLESLAIGHTETTAKGFRRVWRGSRWQNLCRMENCTVQAHSFCKMHQFERKSLPNSSNTRAIVSLDVSSKSCTDDQEQNQRMDRASPTKVRHPSPSSTGRRRRMNNDGPTPVELSPIQQTHELRTRNGRRIRCNGLIWKYLCVDKKKAVQTRKGLLRQSHSMPPVTSGQLSGIEQTNINPPSDTIGTLQTNSPWEFNQNKKRKTANDALNSSHLKEQFNKRTKPSFQGRKVANKSINPTSLMSRRRKNQSDSFILTPDGNNANEKQVEEEVQNETCVSSPYNTRSRNNSHYSIEIPVQSPLPPPTLDCSLSLIINTEPTIKKEVMDDETFMTLPPVNAIDLQLPCNTLQDFLRVEELKTKAFKLDCQRIGYRLAKIEDCIGNAMPLNSPIEMSMSS